MFLSCFETPLGVIRIQVHPPLTLKEPLHEIIRRDLLAYEILKQNVYRTVQYNTIQYNTSNLPV